MKISESICLTVIALFLACIPMSAQRDSAAVNLGSPESSAGGFFRALYKGNLSRAALYCTKGTKRTLQFGNAILTDKFLSKLSDENPKVEVTDVVYRGTDKASVRVKVTSHFNIDGLFDLLHIAYDQDPDNNDHTIRLRCEVVRQNWKWKVTVGGKPKDWRDE
jgi:hypothetical protein